MLQTAIWRRLHDWFVPTKHVTMNFCTSRWIFALLFDFFFFFCTSWCVCWSILMLSWWQVVTSSPYTQQLAFVEEDASYTDLQCIAQAKRTHLSHYTTCMHTHTHTLTHSHSHSHTLQSTNTQTHIPRTRHDRERSWCCFGRIRTLTVW